MNYVGRLTETKNKDAKYNTKFKNKQLPRSSGKITNYLKLVKLDIDPDITPKIIDGVSISIPIPESILRIDPSL